MRAKVLFSVVVAAVVVALLSGNVVWAKAHVPLGRAQICTAEGTVKNVSARALQNRLNGGACRLTACVFNDVEGANLVQQFIFHPGDDCDSFDGNGDNFCDATGSPSDIPKRLSAVNVTPACTSSF